MEAGPEIEARAHRHTGRSIVDLILGVSAIAISLVSLALAIMHGNAMERLVEANSWPFVATGMSTSNPDGTDHFRLVMTNKGIGPARIGSLEVFEGDRAVPNARALLRTISNSAGAARITLLTSTVVANVLSARESIDFVDVPTRGATPEQQRALRNVAQRLAFRTCYCSVFNDCWVLDTRSAVVRPEATPACPVPKVPFA